jgi:phosphomannomutase
MIKRSLELARPLPDGELAEMARREFAGAQIDCSDGVKITLPQGWVHLRRSNTEPIVRAIAESSDESVANELAERALRQLGQLSATRRV